MIRVLPEFTLNEMQFTPKLELVIYKGTLKRAQKIMIHAIMILALLVVLKEAALWGLTML